MSSPERGPLRTIRRRLIVALVGGLGGLLAALFLLLDQAVDRELYGRLDAQLLDRARAVAALLGTQADGDAGSRLHAAIPEFRRRGHTDFFTVWDEHGTVLLRSDSSGAHTLEAPPQPPGATPVYYDLDLPDAHRGRAVALRAVLGAGAALRTLTVAVALEREDVDALERRVHLTLLVAIVLASLFAAGLAVVVVHHGLRPLLNLGARVGGMSPEQAQAPLLDATLPLELAPLAGALDRAFGRLYAAIEHERRFARDVAHELRTPLAEIRTSVELALRSGDAARTHAALGISLAAVERMQRGVDGLLALARYEAGQAEPQPEPLELGALLDAQRDALAHVAAARTVRIEPANAPEWWTQSDPALLERILANLLQNAVEYAPPGSRIACGSVTDVHVAWLEVRNPAPDLTPTDLPRLGERFWRKRPEHDPTAHGGLGLALAGTLARVLGLELQFRLSDGELVARLGPFPSLAEG